MRKISFERVQNIPQLKKCNRIFEKITFGSVKFKKVLKTSILAKFKKNFFFGILKDT